MTNEATAGSRQGFATASLVLGIVGLFTVGILGVGALLGIVFGVMGLVKANEAPAEYGGKGKAIAGIALSVVSVLVMPFVLGIVAAIAIPSLLRARVSANERAAIAEVRTVAAAEAAYAAANGGYFDLPTCLATPSPCIPGRPVPSFLDRSLARVETRHGYRPWFHAGSVALFPGPKVSRTSLRSFTYVLVPVTRGQTGVRSFCTDGSGRVCYFSGEDEAPHERDAVCPSDCNDLR